MEKEKEKEEEEVKRIEKEVEPEEDITTTEEAKAKGLMYLARTERPDLLTELDDNEIRTLTVIETLAEEFNVDLYRKVAKNFKNHRVSLQRKGRAELLTIAKGPLEETRMSKLKEMIPFLRSE